MKTLESNQTATVRSVLALLETNLHFQVSVSFAELAEILASFLPYNFIPSDLDRIGDKIKDAVGPMQFPGNNPNNGSFDHIRVSIGNESSLVIYVMVPIAYIKGREECVRLNLGCVGAVFGADEISAKNTGASINLRLWWD